MGFLDLPWNKKKIADRQKEFAEQKLNSSKIQGLLTHPGWQIFKERFLDTERKRANEQEALARKKRDFDERDLSMILLEFFDRMDSWFDSNAVPTDEVQEKILKRVMVE